MTSYLNPDIHVHVLSGFNYKCMVFILHTRAYFTLFSDKRHILIVSIAKPHIFDIFRTTEILHFIQCLRNAVCQIFKTPPPPPAAFLLAVWFIDRIEWHSEIIHLLKLEKHVFIQRNPVKDGKISHAFLAHWVNFSAMQFNLCVLTKFKNSFLFILTSHNTWCMLLWFDLRWNCCLRDIWLYVWVWWNKYIHVI